MEIQVTFTNWQMSKGKIQIESKLESVGVHANGLEAESVAIALMTAIECLVIKPSEIVAWLVQKLPPGERLSIKRAIVSASREDQDEVKLAVEAVGKLNRDEQEKIATDILGQWGEDIVKSYAVQPESGEPHATM